MQTKWVHGGGEDPVGRCLQCREDEDGSVVHPAELDESSDPEEPWCAVCGHDIDLVEGSPANGAGCRSCDHVEAVHAPPIGCLDCGCDTGSRPSSVGR